MRNNESEVQFTVKGLVSETEVPNWTRRPPKWHDLMDVVRDLKPGQTIVIEFPSKEDANRARNVVRDELNAEIGRAAIRTRLVRKVSEANEHEDAGAEVYFTRLFPVDIAEKKSDKQ